MEEILEISPNIIEFHYNMREQSISIQNLTLHFIQVRIISPNPTLFTIIPNIFSIEPCTTTDVMIKLNLDFRMNMFSLLMNKKLVIFYYDIDDVEELGKNEIDWNKLPFDYLGRKDVVINYQTKNPIYQVHTNEKQQKFLENVQIFQALFIKQKQTPLNDEYKKTLIAKYLELFQKYQTYKIMEDSIAFIGNSLEAENEVFCLESNGSLFYISSYKPPHLYLSQPQYPIEPISPQQQKKRVLPQPLMEQEKTMKKDKSSEQLIPPQKEQSPIKQFFSAFVGRGKEEELDLTLVKSDSIPVETISIPNTEQETNQQQQQNLLNELVQPSIKEDEDGTKKLQLQEASLPEQSRPNRRLNNEQHSLADDSYKINQRQLQRSLSIDEKKSQQISDQKQPIVNEEDMAWDKKAKYQQQQKIAPLVVFTEKDIQSQQASYKINDVAQLKTYQQIVDVLLFRDGKYLITVGEKQDIKVYKVIKKVWQLSIRGLVGTIKELENKKEKKILLISEWRYVDPTADENYEFELKDPNNEGKHQELYTPYETAYRFVTGSEDQIFRIFNLTTMTLEQQFSSRLQIPTSITFMPDRGLFCIGGQPYKTIFAQTRKYRSIRFFCMNNLLEKPKYKVFCKNDDDYLNKIIYSENPVSGQKEHYHARINNILAIQIYRRTSNGKHILQSDRILFLFIDRMNQCTVLMTLECESLNIRGINNLKYLYKEGVFAVLEANDVVTMKSGKVEQLTQKVVLVNLKQLQTKQGVENGIECNLIQEQRSKLQIQMLANPTLMVIPQFKSILFQNLRGEDQIVHLLEMGDPKATHSFNFLNAINNYIVSIVDDIAQIISVN